jgi:hypothetical protein
VQTGVVMDDFRRTFPAHRSVRLGMIGRTERVPDKQQRLQNENKNGSIIVVGGSAAGLLTAAKVAAEVATFACSMQNRDWIQRHAR